jgi:ATP-dependent protease HslVU (ClpYQ) ATPase subunit
MTKLLAIELDALTGEVTERYLTAEETKLLVQKSEALQAEQEAKIAARQSALAKLAALGLTEEEIGAL